MPTVRLIIKGKVQGVFYRATAREAAYETGVKGWIKNTEQGDVEALVTGTEVQIAQFVKWCYKGPAMAKVSEVLQTQEVEENFEEFSIKR